MKNEITRRLPYVPNSQQERLIEALGRYLSEPPGSHDRVFMLNGYAGTGKTSVIGAMVKTLTDMSVPVVLLAPTGRAAKVLQSACAHTAYTIHRRIYRGDASAPGGYAPVVQENRLEGAVFVVDEASMIANDSSDSSASGLLTDLIYYVFSGVGCRLILLGDTAQLPPVGYDRSPAMDPEVLRAMGLKVTRVTITEPARQRRRSGILYNATRLRIDMGADPMPQPVVYASAFPDVSVITDGEDLATSIRRDFDASDDGPAETIVVTRSNRRATETNAAIRAEILGYEEQLVPGERLLIVKNNYHWGVSRPGLDFIANGDVAVLDRVIATEERYGLRWADVAITLPYRDASFECKIMLDTLTSLSASLDPDLEERFLNRIFNDPDRFAPSQSMEARRRALRSDPYFNALRVKYAYCVTCHKAQGGQWRNVYVDTGYLPPEASTIELYRWLYTAVTRATSRLHFINPPFQVK